MKVIILGGFLGSGKTSVLIPLARFLVNNSKHVDRQVKVAVIENEIGTIGIDDQFIKGEGYSVKNLFGGCACCTLAGQLIGSIHVIREDLNPEWLIIESSGVAYPNGMKGEIQDLLELESIIISIVDARRWSRIIASLEHVVIGQLENANAVLINKKDLVDETVLRNVISSVRSLADDNAKMYPITALDGIDTCVFRNILQAIV